MGSLLSINQLMRAMGDIEWSSGVKTTAMFKTGE